MPREPARLDDLERQFPGIRFRMIDEQGRPLKDISHAGARYLSRAELARVLAVPAEVLGTAAMSVE